MRSTRHLRRILLIEDDPDEAQRSRDTLADSGYAVHTAGTLAAARKAVAGDPHFDLVFVDQNLPDGEGLHLLPYLRDAGVAAPVVLVTGNRSEELGRSAFSAGCADLAVKELNYHLWLPNMAEAFIGTGDNMAPEDDFRWGSHVLGVCSGRLQGSAVQAHPADIWPPLAGALESAADLAVRGLRATEQSLLGSLPVVHLMLRSDRHLVMVVRGGVFAAALLTRQPKPQDMTELFEEAAAFARARTDSDSSLDEIE
jgi:CheY-like chemotaxis protein